MSFMRVLLTIDLPYLDASIFGPRPACKRSVCPYCNKHVRLRGLCLISNGAARALRAGAAINAGPAVEAALLFGY